MPLALTACNRCATDAVPLNVMEPLMLPVVPAARFSQLNFAVPVKFSCEPVPTTRSVPARPLTVTVTAPALCNVTFVLPETLICPIVSVGTFVAVVDPPLPNTSTSGFATAARVGVQFVPTFHAAVPPFQLYVTADALTARKDPQIAKTI